MQNKKILFATMPFEGHFNPLTGLAVYLQSLGNEVAWYAGPSYAEKLQKLGVYHFPFQKALEISQDNLDTLFPERKRIKGSIARLRFDINRVFIGGIPEFIEDVTTIHREWPFNLIVYDAGFMAGAFLKDLLQVPAASVGVVPYAETNEHFPPSGMGMTPSSNFFVKRWHSFLTYLTANMLLKPCTDLFNQFLEKYNLAPNSDFVFDAVIRRPDLYLQIGVPGFEYTRKNMSKNVRFVGAMLPFKGNTKHIFAHAAKTKEYRKVILTTQGTVEKDPEKIIVPTLEAFKNDPETLVIVTTGGSKTAELRERFPQENFIIEDFIDFHSVMPFVHVYVTNAGYGGVMLGIQHHIPMVTAGIHEGKSEIAARVGYFKLGINLKTETPTSAQIRRSVEKVFTDNQYQRNVQRLSSEFRQYASNELCEKYLNALLEEDNVFPFSPSLAKVGA
ncbi:MAG: glycosyltransferase [Spirosomataceae bacterium]